MKKKVRPRSQGPAQVINIALINYLWFKGVSYYNKNQFSGRGIVLANPNLQAVAVWFVTGVIAVFGFMPLAFCKQSCWNRHTKDFMAQSNYTKRIQALYLTRKNFPWQGIIFVEHAAIAQMLAQMFTVTARANMPDARVFVFGDCFAFAHYWHLASFLQWCVCQDDTRVFGVYPALLIVA